MWALSILTSLSSSDEESSFRRNFANAYELFERVVSLQNFHVEIDYSRDYQSKSKNLLEVLDEYLTCESLLKMKILTNKHLNISREKYYFLIGSSILPQNLKDILHLLTLQVERDTFYSEVNISLNDKEYFFDQHRESIVSFFYSIEFKTEEITLIDCSHYSFHDRNEIKTFLSFLRNFENLTSLYISFETPNEETSIFEEEEKSFTKLFDENNFLVIYVDNEYYQKYVNSSEYFTERIRPVVGLKD